MDIYHILKTKFCRSPVSLSSAQYTVVCAVHTQQRTSYDLSHNDNVQNKTNICMYTAGKPPLYGWFSLVVGEIIGCTYMYILVGVITSSGR